MNIPFKTKIRNSLIPAFVVVFSLTVAVTGYFSHRRIEDRIKRVLVSKILTCKAMLEDYINEIESAMEDIAERHKNPEEIDMPTEVGDAYYVVNPKGYIIRASSPDIVGLDLSFREKKHISPTVGESPVTGNDVLLFHIHLDNGYLFMFEKNLENLRPMLENFIYNSPEEIHLFISSSDGKIIYHQEGEPLIPPCKRKEKLVYSEDVEGIGWRICGYVPASYFYHELAISVSYSAFPLLIMFVISLLVLHRGITKNVIEPVKYIVDSITKVGKNEISEIDASKIDVLELSFIVDAINMAVRGISEYQSIMKATLEAVVDGVVVMDREGRIMFTSISADRFFGWEKSEVMGKFFADLIRLKVKNADEIASDLDHVFNTLESVHVDEKEVVIGDEKKYIKYDIVPVKDSERGLLAVLFDFKDITDDKRLQEVLMLSQRLESVGLLAGGIAHDFNNILNIIMAYAQLGEDAVKDDDSVKEYFGIIIKQCERASSLIKQILDFARKSPASKGIYDVKPLVKEHIKFIRRTIPSSVEIIFEDDGRESYFALVDPHQIHQVLMNLATNARDAMPNGGKLIYSLKIVDIKDRDPRYPEMKPGEYVLIEVRDTGCGMDEDTLKRVFDPFFTTKPPGKGTGLGLSQAYGIVKSHNGYIYIESTPSVGTSVKIYLPRQKDVKRETTSIFEVEKGEGEKILVVEDEPQLLEAIATMVERLGYRVITAGNAQEALKILEEDESIKLVISDIVMPGLSGIEFFYKIVNKKDVGFLFISGYSEFMGQLSEILKKYKKAAFLQKPFTIHELSEVIKRLIKSCGN